MQIIKNIKKQVHQFSKWKAFEEQIKPLINFDTTNIPEAPDYTNIQNWAAHPSLTTKVHFTPKGIATNSNWQTGAVDCFFVHPTLFFSPESWNAPLQHPSVNELVQELILPSQASAFNAVCRIFAPKYRQATFYSFLKGSKNAQQALTLAGDDVLAAFDYYIENENNGRPFFIAGHSQGALHIIRLLEEKINNNPALIQQLVAAFPIGYWLPMKKFKQTLSNLKPADSATDLHGVIAWDTYLETGRPVKIFDRAAMSYSKNGQLKWERRQATRKILGHNPLNWSTTNELVDANNHLGGVHIIANRQEKFTAQQLAKGELLGLDCKRLSAPYPEQVQAQIGKRGVLYVSRPKSRVFRSWLMPGQSLHVFDISLFYMNIRSNVAERWAAYQQV